MLNRVPPCRCKRPRDTKRFIQAVPLKSSCALWTFIAAHDRCVHTNGSAIAAHNSPIMLRHCWHLLLENLRAFPIWDLQRFDFTFVGRSLCHLRGIRGWSHQWMTAPSGQFAHYLSFQQHLLIYGLLVVHVYIYISLTYLAHSFLKHWIQKTASLITHHWFYHAISPSILTQNRWSVSPALPLSDASSACRRNLSGNCRKFSFQVVGCWMTMDDLKIQTYPDFGTYPPPKKKMKHLFMKGILFIVS